jgi:hypothetical protein
MSATYEYSLERYNKLTVLIFCQLKPTMALYLKSSIHKIYEYKTIIILLTPAGAGG